MVSARRSRKTSSLTHKSDGAGSFPAAVKNDGLLPGRAYSVGGEPLITRAEHQRLERQIEEQNHKIADLTNALQVVLGRLADAERSVSALGRACESIRRSVTSTPTEISAPAMGFPTEVPDQDNQFNTLPSATPLPASRSADDDVGMLCASTKPTSESDQVNPTVPSISNSPVMGISQDQPHYPAPPTPPSYCQYFANPSCQPPPLFPHAFQSPSMFPASSTTDAARSHRSLSPVTRQGSVPPVEALRFTTEASESTDQLMSGGSVDGADG